MATVGEALELAVRALQAGDLGEVERLCGLVIGAVPGQPDALRMRATVALQQGRTGDAAAWLGAVADALPDDPESHHNLAIALRADGRLAEAGDRFARTLALEPDHAGGRGNLIDSALRHAGAPPDAWRTAVLAPPPQLHRFQIEITTWCNLKCAECSRTVAIEAGRWTDKHMRLDDYRRIIDHSVPSGVLVLQGVGEPTLHPQLVDMIAVARTSNKFPAITFNSNAVGRGIDYFARAKAAGLTHLSVSVDSFDPTIANACRFGTKVEKLAGRLAELAAMFPGLAVSIVASRLNLEDIPRTIARLAALGVRTVEIQPLINYQPAAASTVDNTLSPADQARLTTALAGARRAHRTTEIAVAAALDPNEARCARPFHAPYVTVDGYLTPCCTCFDPAVLGHTSLIEQPMTEAWRRPAVQAWLADYFTTEPAICVGCCFNPATLADRTAVPLPAQ